MQPGPPFANRPISRGLPRATGASLATKRTPRRTSALAGDGQSLIVGLLGDVGTACRPAGGRLRGQAIAAATCSVWPVPPGTRAARARRLEHQAAGRSGTKEAVTARSPRPRPWQRQRLQNRSLPRARQARGWAGQGGTRARDLAVARRRDRQTCAAFLQLRARPCASPTGLRGGARGKPAGRRHEQQPRNRQRAPSRAPGLPGREPGEGISRRAQGHARVSGAS